MNGDLNELVDRMARVSWFLLTSGPMLLLIGLGVTLVAVRFILHALPTAPGIAGDFAWDGHDGYLSPEQAAAESAWFDQMEAEHPNGQLGFTADGRMFWSHLAFDDPEAALHGAITWGPQLDDAPTAPN